LSSFGGYKLPVGITGTHISGKRPRIGNVRNPIGIAVDRGTAFVARDRNELGYEANR
jgi:hypothetical protein